MMGGREIQVYRVSNGWIIDDRPYRQNDGRTIEGASVAETPEALVNLIRAWAVAAITKQAAA